MIGWAALVVGALAGPAPADEDRPELDSEPSIADRIHLARRHKGRG